MHVYDAATDVESHLIDLSEWNPGRTLVRDLVLSSDGSTGYAAMWDEKAVLAFDADTWSVTAKIDTGRAPYFGVCPVWLALSPDGGTLYAVAEESDNVVVIDTATNTVVKTVLVGKPYPVFLPLAMRNAVAPSIIAGTVTDAQGTPLAGLLVSAGSYDAIVDCGPDEFQARTATDGSYRLNVTPGSYLVYVNSHHQPGSTVPEAYPDVNSWSRIGTATRIDVGAGQRVADVDLSLPCRAGSWMAAGSRSWAQAAAYGTRRRTSSLAVPWGSAHRTRMARSGSTCRREPSTCSFARPATATLSSMTELSVPQWIWVTCSLLKDHEIQVLFHDIYAILVPGGAFVITDTVEPAHPLGWELATDGWDKAVRERVLKRNDTTEESASFEQE
jgi:YVTN family beta-propeller protein